MGAGMGRVFWSRMETAGMWEIAWFRDEAQARKFIESWRPVQDPDQYDYPRVKSSFLERGVTVEELIKAGLEQETKMLLLNMPAAGQG